MTRFDPKRLVCGHVVVLGLLVLFAGRPGVARPIEDGVQCRVVVGWSSRVSRDGGLVPVSVTLANRVIATDAVIELRQLDRLGRSEVVVRREVVVPVPSEQTHQLLLQLDPDCELQVRVTFSERSLRPYEEMPPVAATGKRLALFVGMTDFLFRRSYYRGTYLFVSVDGETLPRDPLCYDGLHLVAISGDALMALRPNQCEALHRWVLTGGRVAVLGATGSVRGSLGWRKLTRGMTADVGNTGVVPFGMGWLGCDADDSYTSLFWEEDREAMQQFFPEPLADEGGFLRLSSSTGGVFADLAGRTVRRGSEAFSLFWAGLILGTYLLLIGPLAVWAARRWGRPWVRPAV
ncbi:MAG: hypothetical protein HON70_37860, partial [Lentisphaerae bacterium]|nr:hypothetical protein [Lentisphaerota bacterium]